MWRPITADNEASQPSWRPIIEVYCDVTGTPWSLWTREQRPVLDFLVLRYYWREHEGHLEWREWRGKRVFPLVWSPDFGPFPANYAGRYFYPYDEELYRALSRYEAEVHQLIYGIHAALEEDPWNLVSTAPM